MPSNWNARLTVAFGIRRSTTLRSAAAEETPGIEQNFDRTNLPIGPNFIRGCVDWVVSILHPDPRQNFNSTYLLGNKTRKCASREQQKYGSMVLKFYLGSRWGTKRVTQPTHPQPTQNSWTIRKSYRLWCYISLSIGAWSINWSDHGGYVSYFSGWEHAYVIIPIMEMVRVWVCGRIFPALMKYNSTPS